jgi:TatD family hydrolase
MLDIREAASLFGMRDEKIRLIEKELGVAVISNGYDIRIEGNPNDVDIAQRVVRDLLKVIRQGHRLAVGDVRYSIQLARKGNRTSLAAIMEDVIQVTTRGKKIAPRTVGQKIYLDAIRRRDIVFAIGPAGTGKTYLAMAMAVSALKNRQVSKIILTRPVVDAGEKLGFLPGDLQDKVDPYLRPVYDALYDIIGVETFRKYLDRGIIEIAPLAYMRGRTLDDSVSDRVLHEIKVLAHDKRVVAIGEIGLDYHYDFSPRDLQRRVFARQISLARELELPIVVHVREAYEDAVSILKSEHAGDVGGVIHCFSGDLKVAKDCLDMGFYISVGGILTFANSQALGETIKALPMERIVLETDAPYLTPVPYRGKRNEPAYVVYVAKALAYLKGVTFQEVAEATTLNAVKLFGLPEGDWERPIASLRKPRNS